MSATSSCGGPWPFSQACDDAPAGLCDVCREWAALDRAIAPHVGRQLSGGIFIYRQQALHLLKLLREASRRGAGTTFCETGFNAGHASLLGLLTPNVSVVSFDLFRRPYQEVARRHLEERFPGRLRVVPGDTRATLPAFIEAQQQRHEGWACDVVHTSAPGREAADLRNAAVAARPGATTRVMPTAHTPSGAVYGRAWAAAEAAGLLCGAQCQPAMGAAQSARPLRFRFRFGSGLEAARHVYCVATFCDRGAGLGAAAVPAGGAGSQGPRNGRRGARRRRPAST